MREKTSKSSLFFIELCASIVLFLVCAGVCVGLFARAHRLSVESADLTVAVERAAAAAESFRAARDRAEFCAVLGLKEQDGVLYADYDEDWLTAGDGGVYRLTVDVTEEAGTMTADIRVFRGGEELYDLAARRPGKWGA